MSHPDTFAVIVIMALAGIFASVYVAVDRLDRLERILKRIADQQEEANSSLRSMEHDSNIIRERTPSR